jgi:hypothetical protein
MEHFDMDLDVLKQKLLTMASHAETAVNQALQALAQRDRDLALRVKDNDRVIDQFEVEIDELVIQLLTKAPLASNLRLVTTAMKISQNIERIGDEATKIAKRARDLSQEPPVKIVLDLPRMAALALAMLKTALDGPRRRPRHDSARQGGGRAQQTNPRRPRAAHGRKPGHDWPLPEFDGRLQKPGTHRRPRDQCGRGCCLSLRSAGHPAYRREKPGHAARRLLTALAPLQK